MAEFMYIPFWRAGGWQEITYRTQLYLTPLSQGPVRLAVFFYENGGKPWAGKTFAIEIDQLTNEVTTNDQGMIAIDIGPGQMVRIEINVIEHEYGTGEVHVIGGTEPVPMLARGDVEVFAAEQSGFEMSISEITITGGRPVLVEPAG
jgi:hypothetical protein